MKTIFLKTLALALLAFGVAQAQKPLVKKDIQEQKIQSLIKKMTIQEKVGLLHANSKFYVSGVERLGIPEWALSDRKSVV